MLRAILLGDAPADVLRVLHERNELSAIESTLTDLDMKMRAGYRHKNVLEHSFQVLENAISRETNGPDIVLRTAALFHDIGKPATRKFEKNGSVTFENHGPVGAKIVRKILGKHGYSKKEINQIADIVYHHMRAYGYCDVEWADAGVRKLVRDINDNETMEKLFVIFYSDVTTKNDNHRAKIHKGLEELYARIKMIVAQDKRAALRPALSGNDIMEIFDLKPGKTVGKVMKYLNSDEGISLTREDAINKARELLAAE